MPVTRSGPPSYPIGCYSRVSQRVLPYVMASDSGLDGGWAAVRLYMALMRLPYKLHKLEREWEER